MESTIKREIDFYKSKLLLAGLNDEEILHLAVFRVAIDHDSSIINRESAVDLEKLCKWLSENIDDKNIKRSVIDLATAWNKKYACRFYKSI